MWTRRIRSTVFLGAALLSVALAAPVRADQPHMDKALKLLRQARTELDAAKPNKGGHRDRAIEFTDKAINQAQLGVEYAKTHKD